METDTHAIARWPIKLYAPPPLTWANSIALVVAVIAGFAISMSLGFSGGISGSFARPALTVAGLVTMFFIGIIYAALYGLLRMLRGSTVSGDAVLGIDGIQCVDRFLGWHEIDHVEFKGGYIVLHCGGVKTRFQADDAQRKVTELRGRLERFEDTPSVEVPAQLSSSRAESFVERRDRLQSLRSTGYRELGLRPDTLLELLADSRVREDHRTAAAIVLANAPEPIRKRARKTIDAMANSELQFVLLASLGESDAIKVQVARGSTESETLDELTNELETKDELEAG